MFPLFCIIISLLHSLKVGIKKIFLIATEDYIKVKQSLWIKIWITLLKEKKLNFKTSLILTKNKTAEINLSCLFIKVCGLQELLWVSLRRHTQCLSPLKHLEQFLKLSRQVVSKVLRCTSLLPRLQHLDLLQW